MKVYYTRYQIPFYFYSLVFTKILRCFRISYRQLFVSLFLYLIFYFFFALYVFKNDLSFWSTLFLLKKESSWKTPPAKVGGFQMSLFDLNQTCKIRFTEKVKHGWRILYSPIFFLIFPKILNKSFGNSWDNSYKFIIIDVKSRYTFAESTLP